MSLREQWIRPLDALPQDYQHVIAITSSGQEEEMYLVDDKWHIVDGVRIPIEFVVFWHEKREQPTVEMDEDCVKRDDAQDIMARLLSDYLHDEDREKIENANAEIGELPSVQPQPKRGKWIRITNGAMREKYICSTCGRQIEEDGIEGLIAIKYPYCHCGCRMDADMREVQDR